MIALGRRAVLAGGASSLALLSTPTALAARPPLLDRGLPARARLRDPFTLGVASGDPEPDGMVIWTRLAPQPLAWDGLGGMPSREVRVDWQVATDPQFVRVVRQGAVRALPRWAHSVHVEVAGLEPELRELACGGRDHEGVGVVVTGAGARGHQAELLQLREQLVGHLGDLQQLLAGQPEVVAA